MPEANQPAEIVVSRAWHDGRFGERFVTVDGRHVRIIHRGTWSNGLGPDFRDAMVEFDGETLATGSLEIHLHANGWSEHRHHLDPAYDDVILHMVLHTGSGATRRHDGAIVPTVKLDASALENINATADAGWSRFGGAVCAEQLTRNDPSAVRSILWLLGDRRLAAKSARFEARLTGAPPSEVLYQEFWDGLGFAANRAPMRALAERLPLSSIDAALALVSNQRRRLLAIALTLGVGGFFPLAPADQAIAGVAAGDVIEIESLWWKFGEPWRDLVLPPTAWTRAGNRPANHPLRRLTAGAALVAAPSGLLSTLLEPFRSNLDPVEHLQMHSSIGERRTVGSERAVGLVGNIVIPFALALAEHTHDSELSTSAARHWERLVAAESNTITRRAQRQVAGRARLHGLAFRGQQGLIHLDQTLCSPRRCYECPIAHRVMEDRR